MNGIDSLLLARVFFGVGVVVFVITLYIILPAFLYKKRTISRPELIHAMWYKMYGASIGRLKNHLNRLKKKEGSNEMMNVELVIAGKDIREKIKSGLYEH